MRMIKKILMWCIIFIIIAFEPRTGIGEELMHVPSAIHISSTVSDGKLGICEIIEIARENGVKVVVLTDRDFMRWEYGLWPFQRIIKKTVESNSISTYGIRCYLDMIEEVQKKNTDLVLIPGVESAPFYYWEGIPFRNLKIYNWHKHILVIGLNGIEDYKNLPNISNNYSLKKLFKIKDIYKIWPILIFVLGILLLKKRKFRYKDLSGRALGPYSLPWQILGGFLIIFSILFLVNNFPFCDFKYDQYHGDTGVLPYQGLIDYVNIKGGLTFWAHPEAESIERQGSVEIETREHSQDLLDTKDYTGFAIFYEGYKIVGIPGGIWDEILKQYCEGKRISPVWAIGGLAFDQTGDLGRLMQDLRTVLLIPNLDKSSVLEAMRKGKMYVLRGPKSSGLLLDEFSVYDTVSKNRGIMGDEINASGKALIRITGGFIDREQKEQFNLKLIRDGSIIKTFDATNPFDIEYQDDYLGEDKKTYYRLEIQYPGGILVTNPIFVRTKSNRHQN